MLLLLISTSCEENMIDMQNIVNGNFMNGLFMSHVVLFMIQLLFYISSLFNITVPK